MAQRISVARRMPHGIRKPVDSARVAGGGAPSLAVRRAVEEAAVELHDARRPEEISRIIGRRLGLPASFVQRIIIGLLLEHRSKAATLETCMRNALALGEQAAKEAWL